MLIPAAAIINAVLVASRQLQLLTENLVLSFAELLKMTFQCQVPAISQASPSLDFSSPTQNNAKINPKWCKIAPGEEALLPLERRDRHQHNKKPQLLHQVNQFFCYSAIISLRAS